MFLKAFVFCYGRPGSVTPRKAIERESLLKNIICIHVRRVRSVVSKCALCRWRGYNTSVIVLDWIHNHAAGVRMFLSATLKPVQVHLYPVLRPTNPRSESPY